MPILTLQRRFHEIGRIRMGEQVATRSGKTAPSKLALFRLTSRDRHVIDAAASVYGGTPQKWEGAPGDGVQWEVYTESAELAVTIPPAEMAFSQWLEEWDGRGCKHRCDGQRDVLNDAPCVCDPDARDCRETTRLSVILRNVPGLGVWRLESHGRNAAVELQAAVAVLATTVAAGQMLPARLRAEQRSSMRQGEPRRDFIVPVLDIDVTFDELTTGEQRPQLRTTDVDSTPTATHGGEVLAAQPRAALTPVPTAPEQSLSDQVAQTRQGSPKRRAPALPATGRQPRTVSEAAAVPAAETHAQPQPQGHERPITDDQMKRLKATMRECGMKTRDEMLAVTRRVVGHDVESATKLTVREASHVIDTLNPLRDMHAAFARHSLTEGDALIVAGQIAVRDDLNTVNELATAEAEQVTGVLNTLAVVAGEDFTATFPRIVAAIHPGNVDPDTGEEIPEAIA